MKMYKELDPLSQMGVDNDIKAYKEALKAKRKQKALEHHETPCDEQQTSEENSETETLTQNSSRSI